MLSPTHGCRIFAAIDLGASSGRVIAGILDQGVLSLVETHRFSSSTREDGQYMRWDVETIFAETLKGLRAVQVLCEERGARFSGIGIDSWGVDFGLYSRGSVDLDDIRHHRKAGVPLDGYDTFSSTAVERYQVTGVLDQVINTVQQLAVRVAEGSAPDESTVLFIPDVWICLLTGAVGTDPTIASTSQLLDLRTGGWSAHLFDPLGSSGVNLPPLHMAGSYAGATVPSITERIGASAPVPVFRVAGHDTASGLGFAVPARPGQPTYGVVSSGTWSLAGISVARPIATEDARRAGFTTERGLRGFLMIRNLSGMWLLQECLRAWQREPSSDTTMKSVLSEAMDKPSHDAVLDLADDRLLEPGDMPGRLKDLAAEAGRPTPTSKGDVVRIILDSLAAAYASSVRSAADLADVTIDAIRIVGGGSRNALLCQLTADRAGCPVIAGPAEATAVGNLVTQIWASGIVESLDLAYDTVSEDAWSTVAYLPRESPVHA